MSIRGGTAVAVAGCSVWLSLAALADERLTTFDGRHDIQHVQVTMVYFVPQDRTPLPDWRERVGYYAQRIERFHAREFDGLSRLTVVIREQPFLSPRSSAELRAGDADFIFFETLREVESALAGEFPQPGVFPVLLVLSDINWRELDDFYRLRLVGGQYQFEGQIIDGRHFPGAESGGARSLYQPERGLGWGLVSADGWRVPYSGSDCVVYHEGVGHPVGLPHPDPGDGSVMSLAQYQFWINQSWVEESQKKQLGWRPRTDAPPGKNDLFTAFTAVPEPLVPECGQEVSLRLTWPTSARVQRCSAQVQTDLLGPWHEVPISTTSVPSERIRIGAFDRPTPVSYRVRAALEDGQEVELWGYFQVRQSPDQPPLPPPAHRSDTPLAATVAPRWDEAVDLLSLVDPAQDRVSGEWSLRDGRLESNKQYGARIELPYQPPREYVLTVIAEPRDEPNGLILGQRSGDQRFLVLTHFVREGQPPASALEDIDGLNVDRNGTTLREPLLARNRPSTLVCTVREGQVTVTCDGRTVIDWHGNASRLSLSDYWQTPHENALFLGAYDCRYRFHRVTLVPLTGNGKALRED